MNRLLLLVLAFSMTPCFGSTLDQSFTPGTLDLGANINECCKYIAQTYTAGLTGTLAGITVDIGSPFAYPLQVEIQSVSGGVPSGTILGETTLSSGSSSLSSLISFPQLIQQGAGTEYAIVVDYPTAPFIAGNGGQYAGIWGGSADGEYANGQAEYFLNGSWMVDAPGEDVFFQTYVNQTPEPSSGTMALTAVAVALFYRRCGRGRASSRWAALTTCRG
jgi:hypothetical protein